jgi:hypothetical protein
MSLTENGTKTGGTIVSDVQLAGRAAAMGRGVIQDVSAKIVDTFAQNLAVMLSGRPAEAPGAAAPQPAAAAEPAAPAPAGAPGAGPQATPEGVAAAAAGATPPPSAPAEESALPVASIVGSVVVGRLKDPKVIGGGIAAILALLGAVLWRRNR